MGWAGVAWFMQESLIHPHSVVRWVLIGGFYLFPQGTHKHHGKGSSPMERSQTEALKAKLLDQDVYLAAQHLDLFLCKENFHKEVFKHHVLALKDMVQQVCIKLTSCTQWVMRGKQKNLREENVLWCCHAANEDQQKTYGHFPRWEGPLGAHLKGGLTFYEHLFLFLQDHHELRLPSCTDGPHSESHVIGCQKAGPTERGLKKSHFKGMLT